MAPAGRRPRYLHMTRRLPIISTVVVAVAVATMIALGFWQLQRKAEKEALLADYARAQTSVEAVVWPQTRRAFSAALYRRSRVDCLTVERMEAIAGRSAKGRAGWAQLAQCRIAGGGRATVALGWSPTPEPRAWFGGPVEGLVGSAGRGIRLIATPPVAGLEQIAAPDPASVPNNHLSYAVQWFAFAATALIIYLLALRNRMR